MHDGAMRTGLAAIFPDDRVALEEAQDILLSQQIAFSILPEECDPYQDIPSDNFQR